MGEMLPRRREMFSYACGNLTTVRPWNGREPSNASSNFGHFPKKKKKIATLLSHFYVAQELRWLILFPTLP